MSSLIEINCWTELVAILTSTKEPYQSCRYFLSLWANMTSPKPLQVDVRRSIFMGLETIEVGFLFLKSLRGIL